MVSIRKPGQRPKQSLLSFRNVVIVLIAVQSMRLIWRVVWPADTPTVTLSTTQDLRPPPKVEKVPEHVAQEHAHDPHTDADDHVVKKQKIELPKKAKKKPDSPNHEVKLQEPNKEAPKVVEKPKKEEPKPLELTKHGTGPSAAGFVVDLVEERLHPAFRSAPLLLHETEMQVTVAKLAGETHVHACEYVKDRRLEQHEVCRHGDQPLIAYNPASWPRRLCGHEIPAGQAVKLEQPCQEAARLFPSGTVPSVEGKDMPPMRIQSNPGLVPTPDDKFTKIDCDIGCEYETGLTDIVRYVAGTEWKLTQTAANPYADSRAIMERTAFRHDEFYSTTSLSSSVPLSMYDVERHSLRNRPMIDWEQASDRATYLVDSDCSAARRPKWLDAVRAVFPVDAYGSCNHNKDLAQGETLATLEGRLALAKKNRILLAFDPGDSKDYMTEAIFEALLSGVVPAILGASNAKDLLPPNAAIYASSFNDWDKFAAHVKAVSANRTLWESYHAWRQDEAALDAFEKRFFFTRTSPECRTCRWAYATKYGLGWDHEQQVVQETQIPRRLCLEESTKLVTKPFREIWVGDKEPEAVGKESCIGMTFEATVDDDRYKVHRVVDEHDGAVDMVIKSVAREHDEDVILRLQFNVGNADGLYFPNTHTMVPSVRGPLVSSVSIRDDKSKVTVLANWDTSLFSPKRGLVEVVVQKKGEPIGSDEVRRIRIMTEDVNRLHDKPTEFFPSPYGKQLIQDFIDPVELFYIGS